MYLGFDNIISKLICLTILPNKMRDLKLMAAFSCFLKTITALKSHMTCYNLNINYFFTNLRNL